jgi:hypothetical protein
MKERDQKNQFFITLEPAPVLNIPDFSLVFGGKDGKILLEDEKGHIRALEFIALKNTIFEATESYKYDNHYIYKVKIASYPSQELYVDSRFLQPLNSPPTFSKENSKLLDPKAIIKELEKRLGYPYLWGGNYYLGIPKLLDFYPPKEDLSLNYKNKWTLQGVDCSGFLYEVTHGYTPRNTKELLIFGKFVDIENLTISEIIKRLKPLDLIVYPGHVIIVRDNTFTIESRENKGVILTNIFERFSELIEKRKPFNNIQSTKDYFVIKRWIN